jgi:predicted RNase H-like HicB family nuclease
MAYTDEQKLTLKTFYSDRDGGYVATFAELPGISAVGETREAALKEFGAALQLYAEDLIESGDRLDVSG